MSGEIIKVTDSDKVYNIHGNSALSKAAHYALSLNIEDVFICNCFNTDTYISIADSFPHYNFTFVVPLGIKISDTFYNSINGKYVHYSDFYLSNLAPHNSTTIIMTDNHASLYEDLDHFLDDMEYKIYEYKQ